MLAPLRSMRCLFLILVGAVQCARADTILNTLNIWNGSTSLCCFGTDQDASTNNVNAESSGTVGYSYSVA
jgi:hypothetical protein